MLAKKIKKKKNTNIKEVKQGKTLKSRFQYDSSLVYMSYKHVIQNFKF